MIKPYLEVVPASPDAAAVLVQQLSEGDGHLLLHNDGIIHVPRDGEQLRAGVVLRHIIHRVTGIKKTCGFARLEAGRDQEKYIQASWSC